jgi:hypothetical protein
LLFTPISLLPIDFSLHIDFVEPLPNYFAVMLPALTPIFAATLYRVGCPFSDAFPTPWYPQKIGLPAFPSMLFFSRNTVFSDRLFAVFFAIAQAIFSPFRARITEAAPSTFRIPIQRRQS